MVTTIIINFLKNGVHSSEDERNQLDETQGASAFYMVLSNSEEQSDIRLKYSLTKRANDLLELALKNDDLLFDPFSYRPVIIDHMEKICNPINFILILRRNTKSKLEEFEKEPANCQHN